MHNRASFWSPVPDFSQASLHGEGVAVVPIMAASIWWVSGELDKFSSRYELTQVLGPRQRCDAARYGLRVAPDRLLYVCEDVIPATVDSVRAGYLITDISDGLVLFDISGDMAAELMAQASSYAFTAMSDLPMESAFMRFADFKLAVSRRGQGWRLHIERPWAPALWRWLQAHVAQG